MKMWFDSGMKMKSLATRALGVCVGSATIVLNAGCAGAVVSRTPSGLPVAGASVAEGVALPSPRLYVAGSSGGVQVYSTGAKPALLRTITEGVPNPGGIALDVHGILYAVNLPHGSQYQTSLAEYKPGASTPFRTITNGIVDCSFVAVDKQQNVDVACADPSNATFLLEVYPKGQLAPSQTLTMPHPQLSRESGLAFDSTGALLVGFSIYPSKGAVYRLVPGSQTFTNLNLQNATGGTIAVDKGGNLYVGSGSSNGVQAISVYPPNSTSPSEVISAQSIVASLALAASGNLYVETIGNGPPQMSVYAPGNANPIQTFGLTGGGNGIALGR